MPSRTAAEYLRDIVENVEAARSFVADMTFERFRGDRLTHYAVLRALEIVSEASRRLGPDIIARHPDIPWRSIADAGNVYRHVYHQIDLKVVWRTVTEFLDPLYKVAKQELKAIS